MISVFSELFLPWVAQIPKSRLSCSRFRSESLDLHFSLEGSDLVYQTIGI